MQNQVKILLDTNFLLTMVRHKIRGFEEIKEKMPGAELYTISGVLGEIKALAGQDKKLAMEAKIVEQLLKAAKVKVLDSVLDRNVDNDMVEKAREGYVIATNDKLLRKRVHDAGGKTIFIRSLTYIETEEAD
ncbi:MAG: PIN domain-containing protein [archaeon]